MGFSTLIGAGSAEKADPAKTQNMPPFQGFNQYLLLYHLDIKSTLEIFGIKFAATN